ncbi:hypothetical protein K1S60_26855, partial [Klebsiella pneumoniae]|nr:hypothetical protein [Klebsiella pneumoniae]
HHKRYADDPSEQMPSKFGRSTMARISFRSIWRSLLCTDDQIVRMVNFQQKKRIIYLDNPCKK